ncbi:MAG: Maf family protein [Solirubrobacteraceae bacterium]
MSEPRLILASASPQRRATLERLGVPFAVQPSGVPELEEGDPAVVAVENALRKARAVHAEGEGTPVLGVDTVVALDGALYGKPADELQARATLKVLGGATHTVFSGVALLSSKAHPPERTALAATEVAFRVLGDGLIDWYVSTGEWRGRAGGYAIQGAGAALVREVRGDYENVVGLPLAALLDLCPWLLESDG